MAFTAPLPSRTQTDPCPTGSHPSRCVWLIDLGSREEQYQDNPPKDVRKILLGFEFPTETKVFSPEKGEEPYLLTKKFTRSMHEKGNLRKFLSVWRGEPFTDDQAAKFDISTLLAAPALCSVSHDTRKADRTYANIDTAMRMPKGFKCPPQVNPSLLLDLDDLGNPEVTAAIEKLPRWIKEQIEGSHEWKRFERESDPSWVASNAVPSIGKHDDSDPAWSALCKDEETDPAPF